MRTRLSASALVPPALALSHARRPLNVTGEPLAKENAEMAVGAVTLTFGADLVTGTEADLARETPLEETIVLVIVFTLVKSEALLPR